MLFAYAFMAAFAFGLFLLISYSLFWDVINMDARVSRARFIFCMAVEATMIALTLIAAVVAIWLTWEAMGG